MMISKALVPLDGTEVSEGIIPFVVQLAHGLDMSVVLGTVIDPDAVEMPSRIHNTPVASIAGEATIGLESSASTQATATRAPEAVGHESGGPYVSQLMERVEWDAKTRLNELADRLALEGIETDTQVAFGSAAEKLVEMAEDTGCDIIAMSTRGRSTLGSGLLGSVTYKVIHTSSLPILAITPEKAGEHWGADHSLSTAILPLDGSTLAETAIPYATELASKMDMSLSLVRVLKLGGVYSAYSDGYMFSSSVDIEKEIEAEATEYLEGIAGPLRDGGLSVETETLRGNPAARIADLAKETDHNIVILATHGRSGLGRMVLGSVAEAVVRSSGDPVLVIPSRSAE